jgi:hypothetical protein
LLSLLRLVVGCFCFVLARFFFEFDDLHIRSAVGPSQQREQRAAYVVARCAVAVRSVGCHVDICATILTLWIGHVVAASKQFQVSGGISWMTDWGL